MQTSRIRELEKIERKKWQKEPFADVLQNKCF